MKTQEHGRRRFLKEGATLAGMALGVGAARSASGQTPQSEISAAEILAYGKRSRFVGSARVPAPGLPRVWLNPLQDSAGIITPSGLFFVNTHFDIPDIDPRRHRLLIHGMVERPLFFSVAELKRLPFVSRIHFVDCVTNGSDRRDVSKTVQHSHGRFGCSEWTGVPLSLLLKETGLQQGARWVVAESADSGQWQRCIPLEKALDDCMVAYGQNGEPLRPEQGFPLRFLVPGWEGNINLKWLKRIKVVDVPYLEMPPKQPVSGHWEFEQQVASVITVPSGGQRLAGRGFFEITGLAWSGAGAVRRVEISTDGGRNWKDAQLQNPVLPKAATRFLFPWNWGGEAALLQSRATDDAGNVQPTLAALSQTRGVSLDHWRSHNLPTHTGAVQSWEVTRDGNVEKIYA